MLKYNQFVTEKLSDKLCGFDENEMINNYLNDKMSLKRLVSTLKENKIKLPNANIDVILYSLRYDNEYQLFDVLKNFYLIEPFDIIKREYLNGLLPIEKYLETCKEYDIELPDIHTLKMAYFRNMIDISEYLNYCKKYYNELPDIKEISKYHRDQYFSSEIYIELLDKFYNIKITKDVLQDYLENNKIDEDTYNRLLKKYYNKQNDK